jgi:hypothetical protein
VIGEKMRFSLFPSILLRNIWTSLLLGKLFFWKINEIIFWRSRNFLLEAMLKEAIVAEIGVYKGNFSKKILAMTKPVKLHLIDPWKFEYADVFKRSLYGGWFGKDQQKMDKIFNYVMKKFREEIFKTQVIIHRASSEAAVMGFENNYFDWIYIDGNHLYEFAKKDLEYYYPKVKVGGFITGDDYVKGGWWQGGVKKAVDEFVNKGSIKLVQIKRQQYILQKLES